MENQFANDRLKWFEAALSDKFPDTSMEELCKSIKIDHSTFRNLVSQGMAPDSMSGYVLEGILGCSLNDFVDSGRKLCGDAVAPQPQHKAAAEDEDWLNKARLILEKGGENASALMHIIKLMSQ